MEEETIRILIISTSVVPVGLYGYGGIELECLQLASYLANQGHDITVGAPIGSRVPKNVRLIPTVKLPDEQDRDDIALVKIYQNGGLDYDCIHDLSHGHVLGRQDFRQIPLLSIIWDPITTKYAKSKYNIGCVSEWQADRFRKLYNQECKVVWPYLDGDKYKPTPNPRRERFLFVGKLTREKGVGEAIQAAKNLGVGLDVVGGLIHTDPQDNIRRVREACDGVQIKFYPNAHDDFKINLIQNAIAMIYPVQQEESHWLAGIESWCCGTPTIALDKGAMKQVTHPGWGVVVPPDRVAFESSINQFKMNPEVFKVDVESARKEFTLENVAPKFLELYKGIQGGLRW